MAAPAAVLRILVTANSAGAVGSLRATQSELGKTATSGQKAGQAIRDGLKWGALGAGALTAASVKMATDFEKNMRNVNSIAQLPEPAFKKLNQQVLDMAGPTAQAPKVLADGLYDVVSSGFKARDAMKILRAGAVAATAGLTDTATATRAVTAVLNAYHRPAKDAKKVSNDLFQTVNLGVLNFQELSSTIGDVLPFAAQLGVGLKAVGAATTTMTKAGINAPETMTRIKNVMVALFKPSVALKKAYEDIGVAGGQELVKKMGGGIVGFQRSLEAIVNTTLKAGDLEKAYKALGVNGFDQLKKKTGDASKANAALAEQLAAGGAEVAKLFPNIRALGGALALTGKNTQGAEKDLKGFQDTTGATAKVFAEQSKSMAVQVDKLKATASALAIEFGQTLLPALNKFAQRITEVLSDKTLTNAEKFQEIGNIIAKALTAAAPVVAKAFAELALVATRAFFKAWEDSPVWVKLLTGAFILKKMGSFRGLTQAGTKAGAAFGAGLASGVGAGAAAGHGLAGAGANAPGGGGIADVGGMAALAHHTLGLKQSLPGLRTEIDKTGKSFKQMERAGQLIYGPQFRGGIKSQLGPGGVGVRSIGSSLKTSLSSLAPVAHSVGKGVLGVSLMLGIADAVTATDVKGVGDKFQKALSTASFGLIPQPRTISEKLKEAVKFATRGGNLQLPGFGRAIDDMAGGVNEKGKKLILKLRDLRQQAVKAFGDKTKLSLQVAVDPHRAERVIPRIQEEFSRFTSGAVLDMKQLRKETGKQFSDIAFLMGSHSKEGRQALQKQFALSLGTIVSFKKRGTITAGEAGEQIAFLLKSRTRKGKEGLEKNMLAAEGAIAATMSRGGKTTRRGMDLIQLLMVNTMKNMGLSPDTIRMSINTKESARKGKTFPEQSGGAISRGMVVQGGRPIGDSVHAVLERGEVVVNRRAVQKLGGPQRVDQVNRMYPRFQSGGIAGMVGAANKLDRAHFPYQWGGGHQGSPAPFGPMDCSGAVSFVLQHGGVKIPTMTSGNLMNAGAAGAGRVTVFANDHHTFMRMGNRYFGTSGQNPGGGAGWFSDPGEAYRSGFAQRHFKAGGSFGKVPRVQVNAPDGMMKSVVQGALDQTRKGANKKLRQIAATALGAGDAGDPGPGGGSYNGPLNKNFGKGSNTTIGFNQAAMLAERAGLPGVTYAQIAMGESALRPGAVSSDGGYGLWQMTPRVQSAETVAKWEAIGSYFNPWKNAKMAKVLAGSGTGVGNYYGTGSVTDWNKHYDGPMKGLQRGGIVGLAKGGAVGSGLKQAEFASGPGQGSFLRRMWGLASPHLGGGGWPYKDTRYGGNIPFVGTAWNPGQEHKQPPELLWPSWLWSGKDALDRQKLTQLAFHEFAHVFQKPGLKGGEAEGGAESFARSMMRRTRGTPTFTGGQYAKDVKKVGKQHGHKWTLHDQFGKLQLAKGGIVGMAKGAAVGKKKSSKPHPKGVKQFSQPRQLPKKIWEAVKGLGGAGFEEAMPRIEYGRDTEGNLGTYHGRGKVITLPKGFVPALSGKLSPEFAKVQGYSDIYPKRDQAQAFFTLIHEMAHAAQPLDKMKRWEVEGGAEAFTHWVAPIVNKKLKLGIGDSRYLAYPKFVSEVMKKHGGEWIKHGQFMGRDDTKYPPPVAGPNWGTGGPYGRPAKGGAVGYIGDSLGAGTLPKLRTLLDRRVDGNVLKGRSSSSGVSALKEMLKGKKKQSQFIFDLGTNDGNAGSVSSSLGAFNRLTGKGVPLHALTLLGPEAGKKNAALRAAAGGDVDLVDWARVAGQYVKGDSQHIHPNDTGYQRRAQMIATAVKRSREVEKLTKKQKKQIRKAGKGPLPKQLKTTLQTLRKVTTHTKFGRLLRNKRVSGFIKKVRGFGVLPHHLEEKIQFLTDGQAQYGDYADKASQLTLDAEDADGNPIADAQGRQLVNWGDYKGHTQPEWLQSQLDRLYHLRNLLADAVGVLQKRRKQMAKFVKRVRAMLAAVKKQLKDAEERRKTLETRLKQLKKNPKVNRKLIDQVSYDLGKTKRRITDRKHTIKDLGRMLGSENTGLLGTQSKMGTALGDATSGGEGFWNQLVDVQGPSGPMKQITGILPLSEVGGIIFDVQKALSDLKIPREKISTDTSNESDTRTKDILEQLLREANMRTGVSERQLAIVKGFDVSSGIGDFAKMQEFATGGVVAGQTGAPQMVVAHAGEGVFTRDQMAAMGGRGGGETKVSLHFPPGMDFLKDRIRVEVESVTRRAARIADRRMPGSGSRI